MAEPTKAEADAAYDMIDRYLRNNLDDADYAEYSEARQRFASPHCWRGLT